MNGTSYSIEIGGKTLTAHFTDLADQASGSVIVTYGDTSLLATAVMDKKPQPAMGYFPLTVDYEERFYAAGAILGSRFVRREGRPSDEAILSGRVVDRTIRPLFDQRLRYPVQVIITILSLGEEDPDVVAVNAASLALATSPIPWGGPVSGVRIGDKDGVVIVNPTYKEREGGCTYDVLACGKDGLLNMIEVGAHEISEETLAAALKSAIVEIAAIETWQKEIVLAIGKKKREIVLPEPHPALGELFTKTVASKVPSAVISGEAGKRSIEALKEEWEALVAAELPEEAGHAGDYFEQHVDHELHRAAVEDGRRADGRSCTEVRPISAWAGLPFATVTHGSGLFYRGGTHVFSALTLGGPGDSQVLGSIESPDIKKRFMHHYNFPPFAPGETGRVGGTNRRMVGHGALAEKALEPVIPKATDFPYTIRLVSECFASNGSTSMASVCASTLALMDGGVPITRPVAGIAMGLMLWKGQYKVLTDIQGPEDHHGDMDFKVAGTERGITAIQLDVKVSGIPLSILEEAMRDARVARLHILSVMKNAIASPRGNISPRAPKILVLTIKKEQIGLVIGPGGKTINGIREETGVDDITIEEDGTVYITGKNGSAEKAFALIEELTHEYKAGELFTGEVMRVTDFGAFVRIGKNAEGLVHVSEIAPFRIDQVASVLAVGEKVPVVIKEVDDKERINLSIKRADPEFATRKGLGAPRTP